MIDVVVTDVRKRGSADQNAQVRDLMSQYRPLLLERCARQAWREEVRRCLFTTDGPDAMNTCDVPMAPKEVASTPPAAEPGEPDQDTGVPACNDFLRAGRALIACEKIPPESRTAMQQALDATISGLAALHDPDVRPEARQAASDACQQSADAIRMAMTAAGCPEPSADPR
jgi:hypothetical protein